MKSKKKIRLSKNDRVQLQRLVELMQEKPAKEYTIEEASRLTGINRYKLTYGFKRLTGYSIHQFLIKIRMENAKNLLADYDRPVKEVASKNGYKNTQNFIKAFKRFYNKTPSQFRIDNHNK